LPTLALNGGELLTNGSDLNLTNLVSVGGTTTLAGSNNITFSGLSTVTAASVLVVNTPTATFANSITGAGTLGVAGTGTLVLAAPNLFTGALTVSGNVTPGLSGVGLNSGNVIFSGLGSALSAASATVNVGGSLVLDNTGIFLTSRLGAVGLNLNGGNFTLRANPWQCNHLAGSGRFDSGAGSSSITLVGNSATGGVGV